MSIKKAQTKLNCISALPYRDLKTELMIKIIAAEDLKDDDLAASSAESNTELVSIVLLLY